MGSLILRAADAHQVPAGGALAVDREGFAKAVTAADRGASAHHHRARGGRGPAPRILGPTIIATGPLTAPSLAQGIRELTGAESLAFFDAIAPIVHRDSIDMGRLGSSSRYDKVGPGGTGADYIKLPDEPGAVRRLHRCADRRRQDRLQGVGGLDPVLRRLPLPIEVMAERGPETLRHGPMNAGGLTNPHDPTVKACAIVLLRQDNALGTL